MAVLQYLKSALLSINIIEILLTVGSLLLVARQTRLLRKTYQYNGDWQEKEKAIELAVFYKDEILPSVAYINSILKQTGMMECLSGIHQDNIQAFTKTELQRLTNRNIESEIAKKRCDQSSIHVLINGRLTFKQTSNKPLHSINPQIIAGYEAELRSEAKPDGQAVRMPEATKKALMEVLWYEYDSVIYETLNALEYFSMNFITGVADDSVIFQSLHQTFIVLVQMLYYDIAVQNTSEKDMYFTNVIELYRRWVAEDRKNEQVIRSAVPKIGRAVKK